MFHIEMNNYNSDILTWNVWIQTLFKTKSRYINVMTLLRFLLADMIDVSVFTIVLKILLLKYYSKRYVFFLCKLSGLQTLLYNCVQWLSKIVLSWIYLSWMNLVLMIYLGLVYLQCLIRILYKQFFLCTMNLCKPKNCINHT